MAAGVVRRLPPGAIGLGGHQLETAGATLVLSDRGLAALGPWSAARRAARLWAAFSCLLKVTAEHQLRAALLVGFSAFNARLGRELRKRGLRVLWYAPPQVWAWRSSRVWGLANSCDSVALLLPFEPDYWRPTGVEVHHVGHPSLENDWSPRGVLREQLSLPVDRRVIALLPGSRDAEVRRLLPVFLEALARLDGAAQGILLLASSLSRSTHSWALAQARWSGVSVRHGSSTLPAFDAAFVASGTASLDCALAAVPPVITYRTDPLTALLARALLETPYVGLPNAILNRPAFPELLQNALNPTTLATQMRDLLSRPEHYRRSCHQVREALEPARARPPSERVARLFEPWLS